MEGLFLNIVNMSITGTYVILFVLIVRLVFLRKVPRIFSYMLWGIVGLRLICPFTIESVWGLVAVNPDAVTEAIKYDAVPKINTGIRFVDRTVSGALPPASPATSINPMQVWIFLAQNIWLVGMVVMIGYSIFSFAYLKRRLRSAVLIEDNIFTSQEISTPFVFGLVRPKIYLPAGLKEREMAYILEHERTHIKRRDYLIKPFAFCLRTVYWFNPLMWLAFYLVCKDMELSCDERVIQKMGKEIKKEYSSSLLSLSTEVKFAASYPLAFGESNTKTRIKNVLKYKKPGFWTLVLGALVIVVVSGGLLFTSKNQEPDLSFLNIDSLKMVVYQDEDGVPVQYPNMTNMTVNVSGAKLGAYLDSVKWKKVISAETESPDITVQVNDELALSFYRGNDKQGTAVVYSSGSRRYYRMGVGDFEEIMMLVEAEYKINRSKLRRAAPGTPGIDTNASRQNQENRFVVAENLEYEWEIRESSNLNNYNSPFMRYELVRIQPTTGEEVVLDDQLWKNALSCPIIYTGERLIYTGGAEDNILSLKEQSLISIKTDGTDRLVYNPQYQVSAHLTYDEGRLYYEGWTNAQAFPRPIYSMKEDFTDVKLETKIEGSMILVYKGCLYYVGSSQNKSAIYAQNLLTDKKPVVYDKIGFTAEERIADTVTVDPGEDGRMYATIQFLDLEKYQPILNGYDLPLYGHEN